MKENKLFSLSIPCSHNIQRETWMLTEIYENDYEQRRVIVKNLSQQ